MDIRHELYPAQFEFVTSDVRFAAFVAGIGSGKTYAGCVKSVYHCRQPGALGLVVAPTFPMMRDATLRTFQDVAGPAFRDFNKNEMLAKVGGAEVLFRSADNPEHLRGPNLHWAYIDEAALCHESTWPIIMGRLRAGGKAGPCWVTSTPRGRNWLWREFVEQQRPDYQIFRAKTSDNPYLAEDFVRGLTDSYAGAFAAQELSGEFVAFEGLVYDGFDRLVHVTKAPDNLVRYVAGVDWGYTNPAVILVLGMDSDGRAWIVEEFYQRRRLIGEVTAAAVEIASRYKVESWQCDPSEPANILEFVRAGLTARAANNDVRPGIQRVSARLAKQGDGRRRLYVTPGCANTIAEMESYVWAENKQTGLKDDPAKANDHSMDALRYAIMAVDRGGVFFG